MIRYLKSVSQPKCALWWEYARACGWWGVAYCVAATGAQALAVAADCWLATTTARNYEHALTKQQVTARTDAAYTLTYSYYRKPEGLFVTSVCEKRNCGVQAPILYEN